VRVQFWGTRGSIAKPGPSTARYGGNTSCIEVRSARGTLVIVDCGTGAHSLGQNLMSGGAQGLRGHILISHTHWDHIQGIPFFAPLFASGNEWDIYGPKGLGQSLRETLAEQMQYTYFPVTLDQCGAKIRYHDLVEGTFDIDDIKVSTHYLNHPALTLGYRLEADGVTVVYCCDHEPHSRMLATGHGNFTGQDLRHAKFLNRADLLIHDAQYTAEEYPAKVGWGHSSIEYVLNLGLYAEVRRIALTHHDPLRDDDAIDRLVANVQAKLRQNACSLEVFAAVEGQIVEVAASLTKRPTRLADEFQAEMPIEPAPAERSVLLGIGDTKMAAALSEAARAEGVHAKFFSDMGEARALIAKDRPSLTIFEHDPPRINGLECAARDSGLIAMPDGFNTSNYQEIVALAAHYKLPTVYSDLITARAGGLIAYGNDIADNYRSAAVYVDRILKGENAADLPVQFPVKFQLVINLQTAKALGLDVPWILQQRADEVIE
jgi:phosphoribosyl 1,2-cyclic phosphodiesterase